MYKVMLISMPYTILIMPSLGIGQIQAVVREKFKDAVTIDSAYCYLDFAEFVGGNQVYDSIGTFEGYGLHDWMFRQHAFDVEDNIESYQSFYFSDGTFPRKKKIFELVAEKRKEIGDFLDSLIDRYSLLDYDVVGFTSMMSQNVSSFALAKRIKERKHNVITCMGGPNTEHPMGKTIAENVPHMDYIFSGEALVNFPSFLDLLIKKDYQRIVALKGVHAYSYIETKQAVGSDFHPGYTNALITTDTSKSSCSTSDLEDNSGTSFNLNEMPMLDYTEYLKRIDEVSFKDKLIPDLTITFQTSTGCWWADKVTCSFCGLTPHAFRQMNSEKAKNYLNDIIDKYRDSFAIFEATDPCMPVEYPKEVFPYVNQDKGTILQYEVKAKMTEDDMIEMSKANVILPQPGIESLSTRTLKIMRKGVTAFDNIKFLKNCAEYGLYPIWNYLYGFPNDNYDELDTDKLVDDIQSLFHLPPPSSNVPIAFQRYSEYYNDAEKYGLKLRPIDYYAYVYPFPESTISNMAYTFIDHSYAETMTTKYQDAVQNVNIEITNWMFKFREGIPKLYFSSDFIIEDTRYEKPAKYKISETEKDILVFLNTPRTIAQLASNFGMDEKEAEAIISQFLQVRFLFTERNKYMNLVCSQCEMSDEMYKNYYVNFVKNSSTAFD